MKAITQPVKDALARQLMKLEDMEGRKIEQVHNEPSGSSGLYLKFTDGHFIRVTASVSYGDLVPELEASDYCDLEPLLDMGLITPDQYTAELDKVSGWAREARERAEYDQYLILHRRFEGKRKKYKEE